MDAKEEPNLGSSVAPTIPLPPIPQEHDAVPPFHAQVTSTDTQRTDMTDPKENPAAVAPNGVRSSPSPNIPNGKATSPYVKESNPMGANAAQTVSSKDPKAAAAAANDMRNVVRRKLTGYVGFANLPNQWHRKSVRKGFNFNVMVVGTWHAIHTNTSKTHSKQVNQD
jgi:hypothetical protein